jgi:hypothetical protein
MPVVRRGDEQRIHTLVFKNPPKILHSLRCLGRGGKSGLLHLSHPLVIDVAKVGDVDIGNLLKRLDVIGSAPSPITAVTSFSPGLLLVCARATSGIAARPKL